MSEIVILCHLENLAPYDAAGRKAYSLNISAAVLEESPPLTDERVKLLLDDDKVRALLRPWLAKQIEKVQVFVIGSGTLILDAAVEKQFWREAKIEYTPDVIPGNFQNREALLAELGRELDECRNGMHTAKCFVWKPAATSTQGVTATQEVSASDQKPWHIFVGQTAQLPTPIPQFLNLSLIFYLPEAQVAGRKIIAAPVLDFDFLKDRNQPLGEKITFKIEPETDMTLNPISDMPGQTSQPDELKVKTWNYKTSNPFPVSVRAYIEECELRAITREPFLNLKTLWVEKPNADINFHEDWRVMLESRMADAFDLSQRIIEHLRLQFKPPAGSPTATDIAFLYRHLPTYRKMFLASLRDIAGIGITRAPDNQSLLEYVLSKKGKTLTDAQMAKIQEAAREAFGSPEKWREFIRLKLPALSNISLLTKFDELRPIPDSIAEMEQLHQAVLEPTNLAILVREQWRTIFNAKPELQELVKLVDSLDLSEINLRRALALENLGRFWAKFIASKLTDENGRLQVRQKFSCYFQAYSLLRFQNNTAVLSGSCANLSVPVLDASPSFQITETSVAAKLLVYIKNWSDAFGAKLLPDATRGADNLPDRETPTETPHPVSILVDKVADETDKDVLKNISGVGVLMREGTSGTWRCLNMAEAKFIKQNALSSLFALPVLTPLRLNYLNELRQAIVSYNNHPLAAKSPVADMTKVRPESDDPDIWNSLISYFYSTHADAKLSALKFGTSYQVLPFIIGNAGIIPKELSRKKDSADRDIFSPGDIDLANFDSSALAGNVRKIPYQRRVKIGHIRAFSDAEGTCLNLPKIPEQVYPRLRDLKLDNLTNAHEHPLVLLAPFPAWAKKDAISKFDFKLRLPAVDINTWDRWVAKGVINEEKIDDPQRLKNLRIGVWSDYHKRHDRARKNQGCKPVAAADDATLDDPALAPHFVAELFRFNKDRQGGDKWEKLFTELQLDAVRVSGGQSISSAQAQPVSVSCEATPGTESITAAADKKTLNVKIKKGQIYKLKISCLLLSEHYGASTEQNIKPFARIYEDKPFETFKIGTADFNKISPFEMFIETATDEFTPANLPDLLTAKFHEQKRLINGGDSFADLMEVRFLKDKANQVDEEFPYVYKAELQRQVWRWQGRETKPHPQILEASPHQEKITRWEVKEYGNRFDLDHTIMNMDSKVSEEPGAQPPAKRATGSRIFSYVEHLTGRQAKKEELRALHYRFRCTVHSRYAGIMPDGEGRIFVDKWVSEFVPCRVKSEVKVPKVKLIFPLTQSFDLQSSGTAGLLVILDEPWYEVGGIGESLGAEVILKPDPKNNPKNPQPADKFYFEIGADPIITKQGLNDAAPENITVAFNPPDNKSEIRGPVGHTFDRSTDAPLFVSTSFIIPAPSVKKLPASAGAADFGAWGMCKLRLKRVIHVKPAPSAREKTVRVESEFTDPFWVQYLPEFSLFKANMDFSDLLAKVSLNTDKLQAEVVTRGNQRITLEPGKTDADGKNVFELYMILTREVFDATGHSDQEVYVGVLAQAGEMWQTADLTDIFSGEILTTAEKQEKLKVVKFRARIVEIQRRKGGAVFTNADDFWKHLFDAGIDDKNRCRIVRISEPLNSDAAIEKC